MKVRLHESVFFVETFSHNADDAACCWTSTALRSPWRCCHGHGYGSPEWNARCRALRRSRQSDIERDLPTDRLRDAVAGGPRTVIVWRRRKPAPQVVSATGSGS